MMPSPSPYPEPQPVLAPLTSAAVFLVATVDPGGEETVRDLLPDVSGLVRSVGFRHPEATLTCCVGIGSDVWSRLYAAPAPAGLHPFRERAGRIHRAPATPGDLLFHIRAKHMDLCFELATHLVNRLAGAATIVDETHGFRYFDNRDLLGFVDGTENPEGTAAYRAVFIGGDAEPDYAGGSYVIVQKYLHDMTGWNALTVEAQERAIGRTKLSDIEFDDDAKPADSHVALNTIEDPDGTERQIVRCNMPFGSFERGEYGTYFIGYAADVEVTEQMLDNMFLGSPPGIHDRLLDFSTAVTGNLFFVPSQDWLDDDHDPAGTGLATASAGASASADTPADPTADRTDAAAEPAAPDDGSLRIGSLKRSVQG